MALSYFDEDFGGVEQLWVTDGTVDDTHAVASFGSVPISDPTTIGARVFFSADDGVHGQELWTSDGTAAGTVLVKDIDPGAGSSGPSDLTDFGGALYFVASDGTSAHGVELWKSDGTAAGTVMVKDIVSGPGSSLPANLTSVNGTLFFQASDAAHGVELWKSDGTAAGTVRTLIRARPAPTPSISLTSTAYFISMPTTARMARSCGSRTGPPQEPQWSVTSTSARPAPTPRI